MRSTRARAVQQVNDGPRIQDVLEVLGLIPPTPLGLLLLPDRHHHRHQLRGDASYVNQTGRKRSIADAARILRTTVSKIRRILATAQNDP